MEEGAEFVGDVEEKAGGLRDFFGLGLVANDTPFVSSV